MQDYLKSYFEESGFKNKTPIQELLEKPVLAGQNVSATAQTGTGKTLAYLLPIVEKIKQIEEHNGQNILRAHPTAIVLTPTRELARQVFEVAKKLSFHAKIKVRLLVGGESADKIKNIKISSYDLSISVPGRMQEYVTKKHVHLNSLHFLVLDEADQLLDMGFTKDLIKLSTHIDFFQTKVVMVSATIPPTFTDFRTKVFPDLIFEEVSTLNARKMVQTVETFNIYLSESEKINMLDLFLKKEAKGKGIIFANKKETVEMLERELAQKNYKYSIISLHGDMPVHTRKKRFEEFKSTQGILIATAVAARGIDIQTLGWVLNYDLPFEAVYYIHRAGRVGRAGNIGRVFNFVKQTDFAIIERINTAIKNQTSIKLNSIFIKKAKANTTEEKVEIRKYELKKKIKKSPIRNIHKKSTSTTKSKVTKKVTKKAVSKQVFRVKKVVKK